MKYLITLFMALVFFAGRVPAAENKVPPREKPEGRPAAAKIRDLAPEGKKNMLPDGGWFIWQFDKKPRMGALIVKVQAFNKDGSRNTAVEIAAETGMPSMPAHNSGRVRFVKNRKGDYLLPFDVVMPGEWQVLIRVNRGMKEIYAGKVLFTI